MRATVSSFVTAIGLTLSSTGAAQMIPLANIDAGSSANLRGIKLAADAMVSVDGNGCPAYVVDRDYLLVTVHCGDGTVPQTVSLEQGFPRRGWSTLTSPDERLENAGISGSRDGRYRINGFFQFPNFFDIEIADTACDLVGHRGDLSLYACERHPVSWTDSHGRSRSAELAIGDWFGFLTADDVRSELRVGDRLEFLGIMAGTTNAAWQSGLELTDRRYRSSSSFLFDGEDIWSGTSGSALLLPGTRTIMGTVNGGSVGHGSIGTYVRGDTTPALPEAIPAETYGLLDPYWDVSGWVGGSGGSRASYGCPYGYAAAGITGSAIQTGNNAGVVGNFGIVCMPFHYVGELSNDRRRALVIAGRSNETRSNTGSLADIYGMPLYEYLTTVVSTPAPSGMLGQQALAMCPVGTYLTGVAATHHDFIDRVWWMRCSGWDDNANDWDSGEIVFVSDQGIGTSTQGGASFGASYCPTNTVVAGLDIAAGWFTDGFRFLCKERNSPPG